MLQEPQFLQLQPKGEGPEGPGCTVVAGAGMLPSRCQMLRFPLRMENSGLEAGWLQRSKHSSVFKSSKNFFGLFALIKEARELLQECAGR